MSTYPQGSAADIVKICMAQLDQLLHESEGMKDAGRMVLMVRCGLFMPAELGAQGFCIYVPCMLCMAQPDQLLHVSEGMQDAGQTVFMASCGWGILGMLGLLGSCVYMLCNGS